MSLAASRRRNASPAAPGNEMRRKPEELSFHAEKSTQNPGKEIRIEGRE
jgi:hypothetical protein